MRTVETISGEAPERVYLSLRKHLKHRVWKMSFLLGRPTDMCYVRFRGCNNNLSILSLFKTKLLVSFLNDLAFLNCCFLFFFPLPSFIVYTTKPILLFMYMSIFINKPIISECSSGRVSFPFLDQLNNTNHPGDSSRDLCIPKRWRSLFHPFQRVMF